MSEQLPPMKIGVLHCTPHSKDHTPNANMVGNWVVQKLKETDPTVDVTEVDAGSLVILQDLGNYYEKAHYATYPDSLNISGRVGADQMEKVLRLLLESHAVIITMEVRMGGCPALFSTIMERLQSSLMAPRGVGMPLKGKVVGLVAVGHADGASNAISNAMYCLNMFRMVFPPTSYVSWTGNTMGGPTHFDRLKLEDTNETKAWAAELAGSVLETTKRQLKDGKIASGMMHPDAFKQEYWTKIVAQDMVQSGFPLSKQGAEDYLKLLVKTRKLSRTQLMPYWSVLRAKYRVENYPK